MATSKKRRSSGTARSTTSRVPAAPMAGPVTLAEAKALARTTRPAVAKSAVRKALTPPATHATVAAERARLRQQHRDELADRVREYKATMAIMKKRGARAPQTKSVAKSAGAPAAKAASFAPLQIMAEGDSWFDYPFPGFGGGIIPRLEKRLGVPILTLAKAGDEVRYMLGVEERRLLTKHLREGCPADGPWDVLLFSGGGNDIVDNPMALWIRDFDTMASPGELIHQQRFDAALQLVRAGYEDLIALRDLWSPSTQLVFHAYDFAIPDGRGVCFLGPWLKPTFDLRGFPNLAARSAVVKIMLQQFATLLTALATKQNVTFINGQGTLSPAPSSWHNELHPARGGFDQFADIFREKIKALFPNRVA